MRWVSDRSTSSLAAATEAWSISTADTEVANSLYGRRSAYDTRDARVDGAARSLRSGG